MNRFVLQRLEDETGISGEEFIAEGVQFSNGKCALCWRTEFSSVAIYDSIDLVDKIHGHNGETLIHWIDKEIVGNNTTASTKDYEIISTITDSDGQSEISRNPYVVT